MTKAESTRADQINLVQEAYSYLLEEIDNDTKEYARSLLRRYGDKDSRIGNVRRGISDLIRTVETTSLYFRLADGQYAPEYYTLDFSRLMADMFRYVDYLCMAELPGLFFSIPTVPIEFRTDPYLFTLMLAELVTNASTWATPSGHVDANVKMWDGNLVLTVTDDGPGISKEVADHLFEPFFLEKDRYPEMLHLGCATVKKAAEVLGGTLEYHTEEGKGSVFTLLLPPSEGEQGEEYFFDACCDIMRAILSKNLSIAYGFKCPPLKMEWPGICR